MAIALAALFLGVGASTALSAAASSRAGTTTSGGTGPGPNGGNSGGTGTGTGTTTTPSTGPTSPGALASTGMWIWYVSQSNAGSLPSIISTAKRYGIGTLMVKAGDGTQYWGQFNRSLVSSLHAAGLHACAWQYVYGAHPLKEARVGATAVRRGADCLLIDAEAEYEGKYIQAQQYLRKLRHLIGQTFPVGLAGLPYVDFHPSFPYSVFLGPGGAQFDLPQMYWRDIGTSVNTVYAHTYSFNEPYARPIIPIGEVSGSPPPRQIKHFRQLAAAFGAPGTSWWDWQDASIRSWRALHAPITPPSARPLPPMPTLARGGQGILGQGDLVVWAQQHLFTAGYRIKIDGVFGFATQRAIESFQTAKALPVTGRINTATWQALLQYQPATVTWTKRGAHVASVRGLTMPVPRSAGLPAVGYEIPAHLGAGRHPH